MDPLAQQIFVQEEMYLIAVAASFISEEKGIATIDETLAGARDIIDT